MWFLKLQQITFYWAHRNSKFAINIISEQFHFFSVCEYVHTSLRSIFDDLVYQDGKNLLYVNYLLCGHLESKYNIYEDRTHANLDEQTEKVCYSLKSNKYLILGILIGYFEYFFSRCGIQLNWAWSYILCTSTYGNLFLS